MVSGHESPQRRARILLIADDRESGERYRKGLADGGYEV